MFQLRPAECLFQRAPTFCVAKEREAMRAHDRLQQIVLGFQGCKLFFQPHLPAAGVFQEREARRQAEQELRVSMDARAGGGCLLPHATVNAFEELPLSITAGHSSACDEESKYGRIG